MIRHTLCLILYLLAVPTLARDNSKKDDARSKDWPAECKQITIPSTADGKQQPAYFFRCAGKNPRPLIVSLHTWSNDYTQKDPLAPQCIADDYNYIHPDFRGPNRTPEACGSDLVSSDIDDAIDYAIHNAPVDTHSIHVIGVSGGGYATLLTYMRSKHDIRTFSAWASISDIERWYYESKGRKSHYARDIAMATTGKKFSGDTYYMNPESARQRSPILMQTPVKKRADSKLYIYTGIHDGYTGSVPITHSLRFYNKVVTDFDASQTDAMIPDEDILEMVVSRNFNAPRKDTLGGRLVHYQKRFSDKVQLTIFEGGHEMLTDVALDPIGNGKKILAVGDSNGAFSYGWVRQLAHLRFDDWIYNTAISGNTIGFDNNNNEKLNTLRNIDSYISDASTQLSGLDAIIIMLGSNDCKAVFTDQLERVPENLRSLIDKIKSNAIYQEYQPTIFIVSPPPYGPDEMLIEKYCHGGERIATLVPQFKDIAERKQCIYVDNYERLKGIFEYVTPDGTHLTPEGQKLMATIINNALNEFLPLGLQRAPEL
ncbi:MAG: hypothetical protein JXM79_11145 [Sedimentisphaerales bacterium]|nr:hypothetical protein [Sedimentisphaerales bacterium]